MGLDGGREGDRLSLEALFDLKVLVLESHAVVVGEDEDGQEEEEDA
jgi:hypothetical protein